MESLREVYNQFYKEAIDSKIIVPYEEIKLSDIEKGEKRIMLFDHNSNGFFTIEDDIEKMCRLVLLAKDKDYEYEGFSNMILNIRGYEKDIKSEKKEILWQNLGYYGDIYFHQYLNNQGVDLGTLCELNLLLKEIKETLRSNLFDKNEIRKKYSTLSVWHFKEKFEKEFDPFDQNYISLWYHGKGFSNG